MRKLLILLLIFTLCCPCAAAAEQPKFLALAFDGCPRGYPSLLNGLAARNARVTFFLRGEECVHGPELLAGGHEIGVFSRANPDMSRREIAGEIMDIRDQLSCRVRFLRTENSPFDALRQVARVQSLAIAEPQSMPDADQVKDGDVLLVDAGEAVTTILNRVSQLQKRGFTIVTLSDLARIRGAFPEPGERVKDFPKRDGL